MKTTTSRSLAIAVSLIGLLVTGANAAIVLTDGILSSSLTASNSYLTQTPDQAFDSDTATAWNSGSSAGWIEMDLGATASVSGVNLRVAMSPNGGATHQIFVSDSPMGNNTSSATVAHILTGSFSHNQVFTPTFAGVTGRYVQIKTTQTPTASWVSWFEVDILGDPVPEPSSALLLGLGGFSLLLRRSRS